MANAEIDGRFKFVAFVSYSHVDRLAAERLHADLEGYRIPPPLVGSRGRDGPVPDRLFPIFLDRDELSTSPDLSRSIREAIEASANLIVACSPSAARSRWVEQEIRLFKDLGRADRIHAAIVDGDPCLSPAAGGCFPPALRHPYSPSEMTGDGEAVAAGPLASPDPLAADLRPEGDGWKDGKLKLVAGVLGIRLDALRQRERIAQRRRTIQSRIVAITMGALAVAVAGAFWKTRRDRNEIRNLNIPAWRVDSHVTRLDLTGWKPVSDTERRKGIKTSAAISNDTYTLTKTQDYTASFVHVVGTSSNIPPEIVDCRPRCVVEPKKHDRASHAPYEVTVSFDMSDVEVGKPTTVRYSIRYWNSFQTVDQQWGGVRILDPTNEVIYTVIFPPDKHPPATSLRYYFHDDVDRDLPPQKDVQLDSDPDGHVRELTWKISNPSTDRSYRVRWNWDALPSLDRMKLSPEARVE